MAKVTVKEYDVSEPSVLVGAYDLPIYIPGYAQFGPENEPTLIAGGENALKTFKKIFGNSPYVFKNQQMRNGNVFYKKGDYEKSYIAAYEYAKLGYPIVFERITASALSKAKINLPYGSRTYTASAVNPYEQNGVKVVMSRSGESPYTYTASVPKAIVTDLYFGADGTKNRTLRITNDGALGIGYSWDNEDFDHTEDEGATVGTFDVTTGEISITTTSDYGANPTAIAAWDIKGDVAGYKFTADASSPNGKIEIVASGGSTTDVTSTYKEYLLFSSETGTFVFSIPNNYNNNQITAVAQESVVTNKTFVLEAKYRGEYGKNILVSVSELEYTSLKRLTIKCAGETEVFNVTIRKDDPDYIGNIESSFVQAQTQPGEISEDSSWIQLGTIAETHLEYDGDTIQDEFTVEQIYQKLSRTNNQYWEKFIDKDINDYGIFTTGAYPLYGGISEWEDAQNQLATVSKYGLGFTVVDSQDGMTYDKVKDGLLSLVTGTNENSEPYGAYGTMFFENRMVSTSFGNQQMPASFCYICNFIKQLGQYKPWEATAGTGTNANGRGVVGGIVDKKKLGGSISDALQPEIGVRVNPIQYIRNVGNVIMGNATLNNNARGLVNYSFLNIRVLTTIVKRFWYALGKTVLFEQNDAVTYLLMKNKGQEFMNTLLDRGLRTEDSNGKKIEPYTIEKIPTNERAVLKIKVSYYPIEAIERVDEEIELKDGYVNVTETA